MKKVLLATMILTAGLNLMACGSDNKERKSESQEITTEEQTAAETTETAETFDTSGMTTVETTTTETTTAETAIVEKADITIAAQESKTADAGEDKRLANFDVDKKAVVDYAAKIKEAVAEKNIEKLADLVSYPTYVGFPDGGLVIESKKDFIALEPEKLFTAEMLSSIEGTDSAALEPSMAGFTMAKEYKAGIPSITFSVVDGSLGITGINY